MTNKVAYKVFYPSNPQEPPQLLFGREAEPEETREYLQKQVERFNTRYSGAVTELAFQKGMVPWHERIQGERLIYASQGFIPSIPHNRMELGQIYPHIANAIAVFDMNEPLLRIIYTSDFIKQGAMYIFSRLDGPIFPISEAAFSFAHTPFATADPVVGIKLMPLNISGEIEQFILNHPEVPFNQAIARVITSKLAHELTHMGQFMGDEQVAVQVRKTHEDLSRTYQELIKSSNIDPLHLEKLSPAEIEKKLLHFINHLKKYSSSLATDLDIKRFPTKLFSNLDISPQLTLQILLYDGVIEWFKKPSTRFFLGTAGIRALNHWGENNKLVRRIPNESNFNSEREAYNIDHRIYFSGVKDHPKEQIIAFYYIDKDGLLQSDSKIIPVLKSISPEQIKNPYSSRMIRHLDELSNHPAMVGTTRGIGIAADLTSMGMDWYLFYASLQNEDTWQTIKSGGKVFASTAIVGGDAVNYLSKVTATTELIGNAAGFIGAGVNFLTTSSQAVDDFSREEISFTEKALIGTATLSYGTSFVTSGLLFFGAISSGGLLIPVLIVGGMVVGTGVTTLHAEAQEERLAENLAQEIKNFYTAENRSNKQKNALQHLAKTLVDELGELDDDTSMDFFEIVENDPYLKENFKKILEHPTLAPVWEKLLSQIVSTDFLSYRRKKEGGYGLLIVLLHFRENPIEKRRLVEQIASQLDTSGDWEAFDELLTFYNIQLKDIDPENWTKSYRKESILTKVKRATSHPLASVFS